MALVAARDRKTEEKQKTKNKNKKGFNPFRHTIEADSAGPAMSAPSTANARLQVTGSSCHLAGSLPASRQCFDRPGFDGLDFAGHGFLMTDDVAEELLVSAEVIAGFRFTRV